MLLRGFCSPASQFTIQLLSATSSGSNAQVYLNTARLATVTIAPSNNPYGVFAFSTAASTYVTDQAGTIGIGITRTGGLYGTVNLTFSTSGNATYGLDYTLPSNTVTFLPGQQSGVLSVRIINNNIPELLETIVIQFSSASPASVPGGAAIPFISSPLKVSILPSNNVYGYYSVVAAANSPVAPGPNPVVAVGVARGLSTIGRTRILFSTANSTAVQGLDYMLTSNLTYIEFADGQAR